jgi:Mrp family chromosome partitioning ATPase/capsular polysaccharide biosynthesis protein
MELLTYWKIVRKRLLLILAIGAVAAGLAAFNESRQVPRYSSTTTLFLNPAAANPLLPFQATRSMLSTANTYIEFMRTRSFATIVAQQSGLALSPEQVLGALQTEYVPDTQFFRITATFTDPAVAQRIAATAASSLIAENAARRQAEQAQLQSQRDQDPERQKLTELRDTLREELDLYAQRIQTAQEQVAALEARLPSERNDERLTELRTELVDLQQGRVQTLNSLAQMQAALVGSSPAAGASSDTAVIVDEAPLPAAALPRSFLRNVLVWLAAGLVLGVALAVGLEYLDYTVRGPEALESVYGQPVQGVIGTLDGKRRRPEGGADPSYQLTASEPRSPAAESIRSLRTSVQIAALTRPVRSLMVTSAGPGEGKTFTATNLAVSLAQYGSSVILVDLDLRKPNLHAVFGMEREPGFTNLVLGREGELLAAARPQLQALATRMNGAAARHAGPADAEGAPATMAGAQRLLREAEAGGPELATLAAAARRTIEQADDLHAFLRPSGVANLSVITAGTIPPHPSELLGSPRAAAIMERLCDLADIVIFDTPPAGIVTDAVIIAPRVDAVLHVVRAGKTRIDLIKRSKATLEKTGGHILGPVLNQVRLGDMGSYSYYYYYGYGENGTKGERRRRKG